MGPTYIPLTDDTAPVNGTNIGSIAIFGRNNDPNQSIIFVGTGDGDLSTRRAATAAARSARASAS